MAATQPPRSFLERKKERERLEATSDGVPTTPAASPPMFLAEPTGHATQLSQKPILNAAIQSKHGVSEQLGTAPTPATRPLTHHRSAMSLCSVSSVGSGGSSVGPSITLPALGPLRDWSSVPRGLPLGPHQAPMSSASSGSRQLPVAGSSRGPHSIQGSFSPASPASSGVGTIVTAAARRRPLPAPGSPVSPSAYTSVDGVTTGSSLSPLGRRQSLPVLSLAMPSAATDASAGTRPNLTMGAGMTSGFSACSQDSAPARKRFPPSDQPIFPCPPPSPRQQVSKPAMKPLEPTRPLSLPPRRFQTMPFQAPVPATNGPAPVLAQSSSIANIIPARASAASSVGYSTALSSFPEPPAIAVSHASQGPELAADTRPIARQPMLYHAHTSSASRTFRNPSPVPPSDTITSTKSVDRARGFSPATSHVRAIGGSLGSSTRSAPSSERPLPRPPSKSTLPLSSSPEGSLGDFGPERTFVKLASDSAIPQTARVVLKGHETTEPVRTTHSQHDEADAGIGSPRINLPVTESPSPAKATPAQCRHQSKDAKTSTSSATIGSPSISIRIPSIREPSSSDTLAKISEPTSVVLDISLPTISTPSASLPQISVESDDGDLTIAVPSICFPDEDEPSSAAKGTDTPVPIVLPKMDDALPASTLASPADVSNGAIICAGCEDIIIGRILSAATKRWHPACYLCSSCKTPLEFVSSFAHDSKPFCHLCYHEVRRSEVLGVMKRG